MGMENTEKTKRKGKRAKISTDAGAENDSEQAKRARVKAEKAEEKPHVGKVNGRAEEVKHKVQDDDIPVAALIAQKEDKRAQPVKSETSEAEGASEENAEQKADDDDDDEDLTVAELLAKAKLSKLSTASNSESVPKKRPRNSNAAKEPVQKKKKKKEVESKPIPAGKTKAKVTSGTWDKHMMVQQLLCRWWYAICWPQDDEISQPLPGYEQLDAFRGVYVCTRADNLGKILDTRDKTHCPSHQNLSAMPVSELKRLLILAYEEQIRQLKAQEGEDTALGRDLERDLGNVRRLQPEKVEKSAREEGD